MKALLPLFLIIALELGQVPHCHADGLPMTTTGQVQYDRDGTALELFRCPAGHIEWVEPVKL